MTTTRARPTRWWPICVAVLVAAGCEQRVISTKGIGTSSVSTSSPNAPSRSLGELLLGTTRIRQAPPPTMSAWPTGSHKSSN